MPEQIKDLKEYFKNISLGRIIPKDPYSLSYALLTQDEENLFFGDLAFKQALLAYLGDDIMVNLYQIDIELLTKLRNMAMRDEKLLPLFFTIFYGWLGSIKLTRAKEGLERQLQGRAVSAGQFEQFMSGYGDQFASELRKAEKELEKESPLKKFFDRFKKK